MNTVSPRIGYIGIGLMGSRMVSRLLGAGHSVAVWNRSEDKAAPLLEAGATWQPSIASLTEAVDVIMLCLSDTAAVEAVVFDDGGVASAARADQVLVDFSSIDPRTSPQLAERLLTATNTPWIDAPVSGGTAGAEQGTLVMMAGGDEAVLDSIRDILAPLSQRVTHMGPSGTGQMTKLCNQMVVANNALVIAEMLALCRGAGVDVAKLPEALAEGFADSLPFQVLVPQMACHDFTLKWKVRTLAKDLRSAVAVASGAGHEVPMSARGNEVINAHADNGFADADLSSLIRLYEDALSSV